jgi:protein-disulfide isomerase
MPPRGPPCENLAVHRLQATALLACLLGVACATPRSTRLDMLERRLDHLEQLIVAREAALKFLDQAYEAKLDADARPRPGTVYAVDIQPDLAIGQVIGSPAAPVTIVEAWDFACPHCYRASLVLEEILSEYRGKVRLVPKHMIVHPEQVMMAHVTACAAAKQGKLEPFWKAFWSRGYKPYEDQRDPTLLGQENVLKIAGEVGLDSSRLQQDVVACQRAIDADQAELRKFKVDGTPTFFINGEVVTGGLSKEGFKQIIDRKLAIAEQSGVPGAEYYEKEIRGKGERAARRPAASPGPGN